MVAPVFGLAGVWTGLVLFMSLRALAGIWRYKNQRKLPRHPYFTTLIRSLPDYKPKAVHGKYYGQILR